MFIAEIDVFDENGEKLTGEVIGTEVGYENRDRYKTKVFDRDVLTFLNHQTKVETGSE